MRLTGIVRIALGLALTGTTLIGPGVAATHAQAGTMTDVSTDGGCVLVDWTETDFFFDPQARREIVSDPAGGMSTTCRGMLPTATRAPDRAVTLDGFSCLTAAGMTIQMHRDDRAGHRIGRPPGAMLNAHLGRRRSPPVSHAWMT